MDPDSPEGKHWAKIAVPLFVLILLSMGAQGALLSDAIRHPGEPIKWIAWVFTVMVLVVAWVAGWKRVMRRKDT
jgi:hypothetical protein